MSQLENESIGAGAPRSMMQPHRQMLASLEGNVEPSSDRDGTTDDEVEYLGSPHTGDDADSLIGVSIGQLQNHMKSAQTPAIEKERALEESRGYFDQEPSPEEADDSPRRSPEREQQSRPVENATDTALPVWKSQSSTNKRSSITRAFLGSGNNETRKRSGSGPSAILDGIRKILTDLPSYPGFGSSTKDEKTSEHANKATQQVQPDRPTRDDRPHSIAQPLDQFHPSVGLDGTTPPMEQNRLRPMGLRRVTSDNSLYLRRATTGASDFDDTTAFSNIAEMPNPRFKAITDSLADSNLRMPKLPSIRVGSSRSSTAGTNGNTTRRNTLLNSVTTSASELNNKKDLYQEGAVQSVAPNDKKHPLLTEALSQLTGDVVVMGGYRGSVLRLAEPPYHQVWVPVKVGLNLRKVDLEVGLTHEDEERMEEKIVPSGVLSHIGPIDIARRLMKKLRKCPGAKANHMRVHDYGYDWRLSPHFLSQKLIKFLEGLECNRPDTPIDKRGALVIAHSLGGLITRHAVNQRPDLFSGIVYAGAPQNCCNILGPLRHGDDVLLSSRVLTAQVNFTLRTSYALLPEDGRCFLNKETGERYDVDFFDADNWDDYRLSPCINPPLPPSGQMRKSMIGSITDSISSFTPSLPSKRSSWFMGSTSSDATNNNNTQSTSETIRQTIDDAKENIETAAKSTANHIQSPRQEAQDGLEPTMKSSSNKPSIATTVTIPKDKAREYLTRTLAEVKKFKTELKHMDTHEEANRYPPHAIIFGKSVPTVYGAKVSSRDAIRCSDAYDDLAFAAGDGVVLASASQLPAGYRCVKGGRVQSDRGHIGLLGDMEGIGRCIAAVVEGRNRGIGFGNFL